jgi:hypothetical protein
MDLLAEGSNVDRSRIGEVADFLSRRGGRERALTFRGFTWNWQQTDESVANGVIWSVPKRGSGRIVIRWYQEEPPPRGTLGVLKREMRRVVDEIGSQT